MRQEHILETKNIIRYQIKINKKTNSYEIRN
jgi:hypothetical protein